MVSGRVSSTVTVVAVAIEVESTMVNDHFESVVAVAVKEEVITVSYPIKYVIIFGFINENGRDVEYTNQ